jgi:anti-sigma factor ChrR (cupin superfamily)
MPTKKTLTGAALKANRRRVLIDTARADMTSGHPDHIVALLVQAEKARPTRNPEPLRAEIREAVLADVEGFRFTWLGRSNLYDNVPADEAWQVGWALPLISEALNRPLDPAVFQGRAS